MRIDIITVLPEMLTATIRYSIVKRAVESGVVDVVVHDLREYGQGRHRKVDDYPFGGEAGMVMMVEPVYQLITDLKSQRDYDAVLYTSPEGRKWDQEAANRYSLCDNVIILCGHYKGVDQRIRDYLVDAEYSIGDFVLTGGELPAAMMCDSIVRLVPGAIGDEQSALSDSLQDNLLAPPVYTRPAIFNGWNVPEVLLSGNDAKINEWKENITIEKTRKLRPDLWEKFIK